MKALLAAVVVGAAVAVPGGAATQPPRTVAVLPTRAGPRLTLVDARTLRPVRHGWSLAVPVAKDLPVAFSPSRTRIVVGAGDSVVVLDAATGRVLWRDSEAEDTSDGLYWLGGDRLRDALIVAVGYNCSSGGCGPELAVVGSGTADDFSGDGDAVGGLREGVVLAFDPAAVLVYEGGDYADLELKKLPAGAPYNVVADAVHDRLFAVSSGGMVAEIDKVARRPHLTYHSVPLNGRPFQAAWAGAGKIAIWGADGLGTIDTRTWTSQSIAAGVTGAVATPFGIAAWGDDGVSVYRPNGTQRLRVLEGKTIHTARAVGPYLYADADGRYSVDLRTGIVVGPIRGDATLVIPSLVPIQ